MVLVDGVHDPECHIRHSAVGGMGLRSRETSDLVYRIQSVKAVQDDDEFSSESPVSVPFSKASLSPPSSGFITDGRRLFCLLNPAGSSVLLRTSLSEG